MLAKLQVLQYFSGFASEHIIINTWYYYISLQIRPFLHLKTITNASECVTLAQIQSEHIKEYFECIIICAFSYTERTRDGVKNPATSSTFVTHIRGYCEQTRAPSGKQMEHKCLNSTLLNNSS